MSPASASGRPGALRDTLRIFAGEALAIPTGLVTAAFLTRRLGPEGYGLFTLAATVGFQYGRELAARMDPTEGHRSVRAALGAVADALTAHGFDVYRSVAVQHAQTIADQVGAGLDDSELRTLTELCTKLRTAAAATSPRRAEARSANTPDPATV